MQPDRSLELSVIIPCYNESTTIEEALRDWNAFFRELVPSFEIIVVNDGSKDGTGRILDRVRREVRSLRVIHQLNLGPGRAARRGFECARGKYVLQIDCDNGVGPEEVLRLWESRAEKHLVLARRIHRLEGIFRYLGFHFSLGIVRLAFRSRLEDPATPFRLFRRDAINPMLARLPNSLNAVNLALSVLTEREYPEQVTEVPIALRAPRRLLSRRSMASRFLTPILTAFEVVRLRFSSSGGWVPLLPSRAAT